MSGAPPFAWEPEAGTWVGVVRRDAPIDTLRWFRTDPCYVFHPMNAYEDGDKIVVDVCRMDDAMKPGSNAPPQLYRWVIDQAAGTVSETQLDDRAVEFPRVCDTRVGLKNRYGYTAVFGGGQPVAAGYMKYDLESNGSGDYHDLNGGQGSEPVFVRKPDATAEDDGWVLGYVYQPEINRSEVLILDAQNFDQEPVARIHLPVRVPAGFHGNWVPEHF